MRFTAIELMLFRRLDWLRVTEAEELEIDLEWGGFCCFLAELVVRERADRLDMCI